MATYIVDKGSSGSNSGYGNAVAVILFVISFVLALLFQRFILRRDIQGAITREGEGMTLTMASPTPRHPRAGARRRTGKYPAATRSIYALALASSP